MNEKLPKTLQETIKHFSDDQMCIDFVASLRWSNGIAICPHCQNYKTSFLATRKIWKCKACRKQFSVKRGTIFEDSAIGLDKWLVAIWMLANCKNGISSYELHRAIGITQKSAWFVLHRIRTAMQVGSIEKLSGEVEIDETVLGIVQRKGKVRARVVARAKKEDLIPIIHENVEPSSNVFTDQARVYANLHRAYIHETVNHAIEYVRGNVHTNSIENFWSLLKRTIRGTYVSVAPEHLQKYVEEQAFRYNEREGNDQQRFVALHESISGKRLTYAQLIGYETAS
jgi:transposase-like protein